MYKLYVQNIQGSWDKLAQKDNLEKIEKIASKLKPKDYYSYMIIENTPYGDRTIKMQKLYEECKVEYVDDLKTKVEVKAMTFKPNRMKKKEELRKMAEEFIDR